MQGSGNIAAGTGEGEAEGQRLPRGHGVTKPAADGKTQKITTGKSMPWITLSSSFCCYVCNTNSHPL